MPQKTRVRYIGRHATYTDNLYGTGLTFQRGQTAIVPAEIAVRMLKHRDSYEAVADPAEQAATIAATIADLTAGANVTPPPAIEPTQDDPPPPPEPVLDEQGQPILEPGDKQPAADDDAEEQAQQVRDTIAAMDKDALEQFAQTNYSTKIDKRRGVEALRQEVTGMFERFGLD